MQSQAVKEEARFVEDGIKNGNIAASGVNTVPIIAKEEQMMAQPAFLPLINREGEHRLQQQEQEGPRAQDT